MEAMENSKFRKQIPNLQDYQILLNPAMKLKREIAF
jgi:hypothetical protein